MLNRIKILIYKEFLAIWRDKRSRFVLIIPPIMQLFIFAFAATLDVKNASIAILNRDSGEKSIELVQRFRGSPVFTNITTLSTEEEIIPYIDNMQGLMVVSIDPTFSRNLDAKRPATVQLILDGRRSNTTQIVAGYAANILQQYNRDYMKQAEIKQQNTVLQPRNWFNPNLLYYWYNVPSLSGLLTMVVALMLTALSVAREKELGTFEQILVSPLTPLEILIGKTIPAMVVGVLEGSLIVFVGVFVFQIPFTGSVLLLYLSLIVFVSSIVGFGLFISALSATQQQALLGTFVFMSPSVLLSGFATPIENMPIWLQPFTLLVPLRYYLVIAKGLFLKAMPAHIVFSNLWPMMIIAFCTFTGATWFFKRRLE